MSLISVNDLTFYYDGSYDNIFENVSFQIDTSWRLGLVGRNGRGKTTLLKLILGEYEYKGGILSSVAFDYFPFVVADTEKQTLTVIESVDAEYELWKICRELTLLSVDCEILYRPYSTLSHGERTKVLLAVLFSREQHFLLIDEPTNHLDRNSRTILMEYLRQKKGFILVSHDRNFLDGCIDHVLAINKETITVTQGNFSTWWENKQNQDQYERLEHERLKKDIKRLSIAADRTKGWSDQIEKSKIGSHSGDRGFIGHKSAKMMKRAKAVESRAQEAVEEKATLLKDIETVDDLKLFPLTHHKDVLLRMEDVTLAYGDKTVQKDINLTIRNGQRVVLNGKNGCGKSSILKAVLGELPIDSGSIQLASGLIFSYVSQDTSMLKGSLTDYARLNQLDETLLKALLRKLDFSRAQFEKNMEDYSGGQKKKVLIAGSLCQQAHLYLWDEPLNFIDIFSRMQIERLIQAFSPTMLMVEHDSFFVEKIATDMVEL